MIYKHPDNPAWKTYFEYWIDVKDEKGSFLYKKPVEGKVYGVHIGTTSHALSLF